MIDRAGQTDLPGLYAVGETSFTGLHGANRLASNSLLECFVFARAAAQHILAQGESIAIATGLPDWDASQVTDSDEDVVISHNWDELRRFMWDYVGIVRTTKRLQRALQPRPPAEAGDRRVLQQLPRHLGPGGTAQPRAGGGTDHPQRARAPREPRPALHAGLPRARSRCRGHHPRARLSRHRPQPAPRSRSSTRRRRNCAARQRIPEHHQRAHPPRLLHAQHDQERQHRAVGAQPHRLRRAVAVQPPRLAAKLEPRAAACAPAQRARATAARGLRARGRPAPA